MEPIYAFLSVIAAMVGPIFALIAGFTGYAVNDIMLGGSLYSSGAIVSAIYLVKC